MSGPIRLKPPLSDEDAERLKIGDRILINGIIYTGRDAAHKRLFDLLKEGKNLPFDIKGQIIYYVGPTPAKPGQALGSAGPTTSYRMDAYSPSLIERGLKGMIGKGMRSDAVKEAMKKYKAVYFAATGGAGALLAKRVKKAEIVAYEDLGPEAIRRLEVEDLPVIVVNDVRGNDLYLEGEKKYFRGLRQGLG
ncbi:MAG TPA: Fe-S-containing hydro-lyase [Thermodesulfobacteriota bacterium]|jgi:fumarate hydratase subunit beta|nr:Fe-S-containing hydro-lyase [Thermodesulfobacteriota bacterium]